MRSKSKYLTKRKKARILSFSVLIMILLMIVAQNGNIYYQNPNISSKDQSREDINKNLKENLMNGILLNGGIRLWKILKNLLKEEL